MSRLIALFTLIFMIGALLIGCAKADKGNDTADLVEKVLAEEKESNSTVNEEEKSIAGGEQESSTTDDSENTTPPEGEAESKPAYTVGTQLGNIMKGVELEVINGGVVSAEDFRGKVIVFNLWATWCPPCRDELPDFDKIASEYGEEAVVIAAHVSSSNQSALSYVNTNFPESKIIFAYDNANGDAYYAAGGDGYVPYTVILDRDGIIRYSDSGALSYDGLKQIIDSLL